MQTPDHFPDASPHLQEALERGLEQKRKMRDQLKTILLGLEKSGKIKELTGDLSLFTQDYYDDQKIDTITYSDLFSIIYPFSAPQEDRNGLYVSIEGAFTHEGFIEAFLGDDPEFTSEDFTGHRDIADKRGAIIHQHMETHGFVDATSVISAFCKMMDKRLAGLL